MEPRIIFKSAFSVIGIWKNGIPSSSSLDTLWQQLGDRYVEIPYADPDQGYGVHVQSKSEHQYLAGLALKSEGIDGMLPQGLAKLDLGANAYAVFHHRGKLQDLDSTLDMIFSAWLPGSGYQQAAEFFFEYYDDRFQPGSNDSILFIYVPVSEKQGLPAG